MPAGRYRHRIRFEAPTRERRSDGQEVDVWNPIVDTPVVWASIEFLEGAEVFDAQALLTRRPVRIETRYRGDITTLHRAVDVSSGVAYGIIAPPVDVDGRRKELEILAEVVEGA